MTNSPKDESPNTSGPIDRAKLAAGSVARVERADAGLTRRGVLRGVGSIGALAALGGVGACAGSRSGTGEPGAAMNRGGDRRGRAARLIHFTDAHIRPEFEAVAGTGAALAHACASVPDADVLLTGGDLIMHSMDQTQERTAELWGLWQETFAKRCKLPVMHCIGNHDIWGWNTAKSGSTGSEALWGKKWWMQVCGVDRTYFSTDIGRWHIVVLDSIQPLGDSYQGLIDEQQWAWLEKDLASVGPDRHTLIVSHIPIFSVGLMDCDAKRAGPVLSEAGLDPASSRATALVIQGGAMLMDCHRLMRLMQRVGNVRACLSGHIHIVESLRYGGIDFHCSGAVSGMWWRGLESNRKFGRERLKAGDVDVNDRPARAEPGYAVVDLMDDGRVGFEYRTFGWTYAQP